MFADAGSATPCRRVRGAWSLLTTRNKKTFPEETYSNADLPGRAPAAADAELFQWASFSEALGRRFTDGVGVDAAQRAMSMRSPNPRFTILVFPVWTVVNEFQDSKGLPAWRLLEERVDLRQVANLQMKSGHIA